MSLTLPPGPLRVLGLGAHPDDLEIGAGGLLLTLANSVSDLTYQGLILTSTAERQVEAERAVTNFLPGCVTEISFAELPDGLVPHHWLAAKTALARVAASFSPDVIICPQLVDAHQDHRTLAELVPTVFRDHLVLGYEIPKWDGDLGRGAPGIYVSLDEEVMARKCDLLRESFPSQIGRDWFDDKVFRGLARLRGMECRAPYAEAYTCNKMTLTPRREDE
ncbi:MAG: PIG-L family deacetylase [Actinomycetia bacterium]|nr:PIG-L family deacetylase [Actinomycetes bacterium]MCH9801349.1 PIG-L family deacetylase [Actinomycetes bacterium]